MDENGISNPGEPTTRTTAAGADAGDTGTRILVAVDRELLGEILVADPVRRDARNAVSALYDNGVKRVVMLTGDNEDTAKAVAKELGVTHVHADLLPDQKLDQIERLREEGYVTAMVGDGINDSPALAAADVGIAMGAAGSDVAIETADIALMKDDLHVLARAIGRARSTLRNIRQNVTIAVVTVVALLAGVLLGEVHMAGGMLVHEASVMVVILNGMRLLRG
jgi:Cd2+/Zn2+-exporting ATPase